MTNLLDTCGMPEFIDPWADRFYSPQEIELLTTLGDKARTGDEIQNLSGPEWNDRFLERAWQRGVVQRLDGGRIMPSDFHDRFEIWALFEGWKDLPADVKNQLNRWELDHYVAAHRDTVESLKAGRPRPMGVTCPEYLLLDEVARLFGRIGHFYLWPCNCRAMIGGCAQSQLTCIRFSNPRGIGWEISRERALSIAEAANRQGLMQSAELAVDSRGRLTGALCNCCNDCCFPHQLARERQAEKIWPLSRYLAELASEPCNGCGRCVRRCPFGAISQEKKKKGRPPATPIIDEALCRGCGLCASGCPQDAVRMVPVGKSALESYYI